MTRMNPPALIDPRDAVRSITDRNLGIKTARETDERIAALERTVAALSNQITSGQQFYLPVELPQYQVVGGDAVLTQYASLIAVEENPNPGLTIGSAAGTGGSAGVSFSRGGSDVAGQIRVICGTSGHGTGTLVTLAFNVAKPNTNYIVLIAPASSAARAANLSVSTMTTAGFPISANTAPTSGQQIDINYLIVETPAT